MNPPRRTYHLIVPLAMLVLTAIAVADEPTPAADEATAKLVTELFGDQIKAAAATREIDDDVAVADLMLDTALSNAQHEQLLVSVCFRIADDLGKRVGGHESAARALALLSLRRPAYRPQCLERLVAIRQHQSTVAHGKDRTAALAASIAASVALAETHLDAGRTDEALRLYQDTLTLARRVRMRGSADAITAILDAYRPLIEATRRADQLKARLQTNPNDKDAARALVTLYLLELDNPTEARKFAFLIADTDLEARIKLASSPITNATEPDALALAEWYPTLLTADSPVSARRTVQQRIIACLRRYLALHTAADLDRTKAEIRLKQATAALADFDKPAAKP